MKFHIVVLYALLIAIFCPIASVIFIMFVGRVEKLDRSEVFYFYYYAPPAVIILIITTALGITLKYRPYLTAITSLMLSGVMMWITVWGLTGEYGLGANWVIDISLTLALAVVGVSIGRKLKRRK